MPSSPQPALTMAERQQIEDAFRLFDTDGKGVIDPKELQEVVERLDLADSNRTVAEFLQLLRQHERHPLTLEDFMSLVTHQRSKTVDDDSNVNRVFDLFDADGKGYLTREDLKRVAEELGETMTDQELQDMIDCASPTTGHVTRKDFEAIMTKQLFS